MGRERMEAIGIGAAWALVVVIVIATLSGCATQERRCAVAGEQVQRVGENSAGDYVQVRSFVEVCKAAI